MATGFECHGTLPRSLGKMSRMKRSMSSVQSSMLTTRLGTFASQSWVARSPARWFSSIVPQSWMYSFVVVRRCVRLVLLMPLAHFLWTRLAFVGLRPAPVSSRHSAGVRVREWTSVETESLWVGYGQKANFSAVVSTEIFLSVEVTTASTGQHLCKSLREDGDDTTCLVTVARALAVKELL